MKDNKATYECLVSVESLAGLESEKALQHIGQLIDISWDLRKMEGIEKAISLVKEAHNKFLLSSQQLALLYYFEANAWAHMRRLSRINQDDIWAWEQNEIEMEIISLRKSTRQKGFHKLSKILKCRVLTNLANALNHIGRFFEALEFWDRALEEIQDFGMALGNKGCALSYCTTALYDQGHKVVFLGHAHDYLKRALTTELHEEAKEGFEKCVKDIEDILPPDCCEKSIDQHNYSLGISAQEVDYRRWCLKHCLFLNPLNDLGPFPIAARDVFTTPSIVMRVDEGPYYQGYFNQMKQEFVSARYLLYEGITRDRPHFSDRDVLLYNTLDYPSYSFAIEEVKATYRIAYSLFDKMAYFLNHYFGLSIPERKVNLRSFWYVSQNPEKGLRKEFIQRANWPLRGLFWLSKDLYDRKGDLTQSIEPDSQKLADIRNHLEHKYLKIHETLWVGKATSDEKYHDSLEDTLAYSLFRRDFEDKTLRLLNLSRAALIYLSLAIHREEQQRANEMDPESIITSVEIDAYDDAWKV